MEFEIYGSKVCRSSSGVWGYRIIVESVAKPTWCEEVIEKPMKYVVNRACLAEYN